MFLRTDLQANQLAAVIWLPHCAWMRIDLPLLWRKRPPPQMRPALNQSVAQFLAFSATSSVPGRHAALHIDKIRSQYFYQQANALESAGDWRRWLLAATGNVSANGSSYMANAIAAGLPANHFVVTGNL